ncbi:hypothetical protein Lesp02_03220 [Lentzea sp. NBRC 105346]|nr:hypothetical protein Lesp02_03220 [Lentzea sp. NBRC 105346]
MYRNVLSPAGHGAPAPDARYAQSRADRAAGTTLLHLELGEDSQVDDGDALIEEVAVITFVGGGA